MSMTTAPVMTGGSTARTTCAPTKCTMTPTTARMSPATRIAPVTCAESLFELCARIATTAATNEAEVPT